MENNAALLISLQASAFATFKQVNAFSFNHKSVGYSFMNHYASKKQFDNIMYYAYSDIGRNIYFL